jgi:hypothetical protein
MTLVVQSERWCEAVITSKSDSCTRCDGAAVTICEACGTAVCDAHEVVCGHCGRSYCSQCQHACVAGQPFRKAA